MKISEKKPTKEAKKLIKKHKEGTDLSIKLMRRVPLKYLRKEIRDKYLAFYRTIRICCHPSLVEHKEAHKLAWDMYEDGLNPFNLKEIKEQIPFYVKTRLRGRGRRINK